MTGPYDWSEDDDDYRGDDRRRLKIGAAIAAAAIVAVWAWTRDNQPEQATLTPECVTADLAPTPAPVIEQFTINVAEPSPPVTGQPPPPVDLETSAKIVGGDR